MGVSILTKPAEPEGKEQGRLSEHYVTLDGRVLLCVDKYEGYYRAS